MREVKRAALPRKLLTFGSDRKVSKVDVAGFKTAMNYKPPVCAKNLMAQEKKRISLFHLPKTPIFKENPTQGPFSTNCVTQEMTKRL
ncbi:MAG: hypothetical protein IPL25_10205 [Saprospiraceae bacterium]|nr:hypothetical protein [Candidatus Vicinibacter affinis]